MDDGSANEFRDFVRLCEPVAGCPDGDACVGARNGFGLGGGDAARVANHGGAVAAEGLADQGGEVGGVGWLDDGEIGEALEHREVVDALVGGAVLAHHAGAVHAEDHGEVGDADIVHNLVDRPLEEGRIDGHEWAHAAGGQAGGKGDHVPLGDSNVAEAVGKFLRKGGKARSLLHGRRDGADAPVFTGEGAERFAHGPAPGLRLLRLGLRRGTLAARGDSMPCHRVVLGGGVAFSLYGDDMHEDAALVVPGHGEGGLEGLQVVAVNWPDVAKSEALEECAAEEQPLEETFHPVICAAQEGEPHAVAGGFRGGLDAVVVDVGDEPAKKTRQRAG